MNKNFKGFTILELCVALCVLAIITVGVLFSLEKTTTLVGASTSIQHSELTLSMLVEKIKEEVQNSDSTRAYVDAEGLHYVKLNESTPCVLKDSQYVANWQTNESVLSAQGGELSFTKSNGEKVTLCVNVTSATFQLQGRELTFAIVLRNGRQASHITAIQN